jgi:hypothetical protein
MMQIIKSAFDSDTGVKLPSCSFLNQNRYLAPQMAIPARYWWFKTKLMEFNCFQVMNCSSTSGPITGLSNSLPEVNILWPEVSMS